MTTETATASDNDDRVIPSDETEGAATAQDDSQGTETEADEVEGSADDQSEGEGDGLEDVEWEGAKARIPPVMKAALLRTQDYTQKTQALAVHRQELDQRATALDQQAEAVKELRAEYGKVEAMKVELGRYAVLDYTALEAAAREIEDPAEREAKRDQIRAAEREHQRLLREIPAAEQGLTQKETERLQTQRAALATQMQETGRVLARDIPGWNNEVIAKVAQYATAEVGISAEELRETTDPRIWKLIHQAMVGSQAQAKQTSTQRHAAAQATTPARSVAGKASPSTGPDDRNSTKSWMERRNAQLAAKR